MKYTVLDTNIILLDHTTVMKYAEDSIVVIPETVLVELDSKKSQIGELGYQARAFARFLAGCETADIRSNTFYTEVCLRHNSLDIRVISPVDYPDFDDASSANDRRIIYAASRLQTSGYLVELITNDNLCRVLALTAGIPTRDHKIVEKTSFTFTKSLEIDPDNFSTIHRQPIVDVDSDYTNENYNYVFTCGGQSKLGIVTNGTIDIIGRTSEEQLRRQNVNPIGSDQLMFSAAIQHPDIDIILCEARAGTGLSSSLAA